jgi:hypothetical protein
MRLEDIFLARFADLTPDGLFTIVGGGVNRINAGGLPWSWGILFMLARLRFSPEEAAARHTAAVERQTPDGQIEPLGDESSLPPLSSDVEIGPDGMVGLNFTYCLVSLQFPRAGVYKYRLKIDGHEVGAVELLVAGPEQGEQGR